MKKLKLNTLSAARLEDKELSQIVGGAMCGCACSSNSIDANGNANQAGGKYSKGVPKTDQNIFLDTVIITPQK